MAIWIEANQRKVGSEIEPNCLILISNLELQLKPAATAGFSSILVVFALACIVDDDGPEDCFKVKEVGRFERLPTCC